MTEAATLPARRPRRRRHRPEIVRGRPGGGRGHGGRRRSADGGLGAAAAGRRGHRRAAPPSPTRPSGPWPGWTAGCWAPTAPATPSRTARPSTPAAPSASTSTCSPTSVRPRTSRARAVSSDTDLVIVRENTQGFYADRSTYAGTGSSCRPRTWPSPWASSPGRPSGGSPRSPATWPSAAAGMTIVHKANVLEADHRPVPRRLPRDRGRLPGFDRRRLPHRRHDRAPGAALTGLRRPGDREHDGRHPLRPGRRDRRVARHRPLRSTPPTTSPWPRPPTARPRHRRPRPGQPDRHGQFQRDAAGVAGRSHGDPAAASRGLVEQAVIDTVKSGVAHAIGGTAFDGGFTTAVVDAIARR